MSNTWPKWRRIWRCYGTITINKIIVHSSQKIQPKSQCSNISRCSRKPFLYMLFGQRPAKKEVFETIFNNTDIAPFAEQSKSGSRLPGPLPLAALAARWLGDKSNYLSELEFSQLIKVGGKKRATKRANQQEVTVASVTEVLLLRLPERE